MVISYDTFSSKLTFENFFRLTLCHLVIVSSGKFSKVDSLPNFIYLMTKWLSFEDVYLLHLCHLMVVCCDGGGRPPCTIEL